MKSILLASTALVAFTGAALAEAHETPAGVSFGGDATLGYNDDIEGGVYWDATLTTMFSQPLDNGLTVSATFDIDVVGNDLGTADLDAGDYVLTLASDTASLSFGDLDPVAEDRFDGVDGLAAETFNDQDVHLNAPADGGVGFDAMLVGEVTFGGVTAAISYGVDAAGGRNLDAMQLYASGTFGMVDAELAYQEAFAGASEILGIGASTTFGGADVGFAYVDNGIDTSIGADVFVTFGDVTVGGYYAMNDVAPDAYGFSVDYASGPIAVNLFYDDTEAANTDDFGIEGSYDVGNGIVVFAGFVDSGDARYVAATYDLGGGASVLFSYAEDDNNPANDEIGDPEYLHGSTIELSFEF